jgi:hypothetical protein
MSIVQCCGAGVTLFWCRQSSNAMWLRLRFGSDGSGSELKNLKYMSIFKNVTTVAVSYFSHYNLDKCQSRKIRRKKDGLNTFMMGYCTYFYKKKRLACFILGWGAGATHCCLIKIMRLRNIGLLLHRTVYLPFVQIFQIVQIQIHLDRY